MKIIYLLSSFLLVTGWILPVHFPPWQTSYQEFITAISLFLLLIVLVKNNANRVGISDIFIIFIAAMPAVQYLQGWIYYSGDMLHSMIYIALFGLSIFVGRNIQKNKDDIDFQQLLGWVFIVGALLSLIVAILQWLKISEGADMALFTPLENGRPYANLGQPNNLATLFGFGLAGVFYLFEKNKIRNNFALVLAGLLIFGLALTQSRTPWVVAAILPFFWLWQSRRMPLRTTSRHVLLLVAVYAGFVLMLPVLGRFLDVSVSSVLDRATQAHRWDMYKQALYFITHGPWHGFGWGQIESAHYLFAGQAPSAIFYHYSHNIVLDMLLWNGPWIGGAIVVFFTVWLGKLFFQKNTVESLFAWVGLLFFLTHSMLEYPHAYLFLLLPAGLLIGVIEGQQKNRSFEIPVPKILVAIIAVAGLAGTAVFWKNYSIIEDDYRMANRRMEVDFVPEEQQAASQTMMLSNVQSFIYFMRLPLKEGYSAERLQWTEDFIIRYPRKYSLTKFSYILALNHQQDKAITQLIKLKDIFGISALEEALSYLYQESEKTPELLPVLAHFGLVKKAPAAAGD
ncbi:MAG: O-antigen ligase C-terminal domain-containing protein [Comamonas sp.]|nr:O-antigen ligase C-terminal domain-containing protein [Comamonas sp.]